MPLHYPSVLLYHITEIANLPSIIQGGWLLSDARVASLAHEVIGHGHIKARRLTELTIPCCGNRFVGEFVPFYYCPRSPMLFTINQGNVGKPRGHQKEIVHLVTTVQNATGLNFPWAISDGNAGARGVLFNSEIEALDALDWGAIRTTNWAGLTRQKQAEFLVADYFPWSYIESPRFL
ncbi:type II toxin-antitoxin system toxin DNA ADP-ribosyl transferase DarT [Lysobacter gummosus]|uniref:DUF4433 domain-containing protein n=1 Tax=Lysobacter gummosus TaxID=262324 RepID=A0ABY3XDJ4_9GAMM|nr:DUF4433 domain-containing protein [Lysobacter gummosus]UNP28073.1 DUF4433 domain-containing protein [Lysobacter gummosus]